MIEVAGLTKLYGDFVAVRDLSFTVRPGEVLGLVGPNGAGKTTTLRCIAASFRRPRGRVRIGGHDLADRPDRRQARARLLARRAAPVRLPDRAPAPALSSRGSTGSRITRRSRQPLLEELEITDKADQLPGELSRGMKQKLAIACGLLHSPQVMFFDEPLTGLDPLGIRRMKDTIVRRARAGAAIVVSSHLLHLLEEVCSHVLILKNGEKIADGTIAEVPAQFSNGEAGRESRGRVHPRDGRIGAPAPWANAIGALFYLRVTSLRNAVHLARPRGSSSRNTSIGAIVGVAYFYLLFFGARECRSRATAPGVADPSRSSGCRRSRPSPRWSYGVGPRSTGCGRDHARRSRSARPRSRSCFPRR